MIPPESTEDDDDLPDTMISIPMHLTSLNALHCAKRKMMIPMILFNSMPMIKSILLVGDLMFPHTLTKENLGFFSKNVALFSSGVDNSPAGTTTSGICRLL